MDWMLLLLVVTMALESADFSLNSNNSSVSSGFSLLFEVTLTCFSSDNEF
jgi:hypothetical protein